MTKKTAKPKPRKKKKREPATPEGRVTAAEKKELGAWERTNRAIDLLPRMRQRKFVLEYLVDLNASAAARRAGYSEKTAGVIGCENLKKPNIALAIDQEMAAQAGITRVRIIDELAAIAFGDIRNAVRWGRNPGDKTSENANPNGLGIYPVSLVPSEEIDDRTAMAVSEVSLTQTGIRLKMHDKQAALDKLARATQLYNDTLELKGSIAILDAEDHDL